MNLNFGVTNLRSNEPSEKRAVPVKTVNDLCFISTSPEIKTQSLPSFSLLLDLFFLEERCLFISLSGIYIYIYIALDIFPLILPLNINGSCSGGVMRNCVPLTFANHGSQSTYSHLSLLRHSHFFPKVIIMIYCGDYICDT